MFKVRNQGSRANKASRRGGTAHTRLARLIISESQSEHDGQPEERANDDQLGTSHAIARMHKEENHEGGLSRGDGKSDDDIEPSKVLKCRPSGKARANNQGDEDSCINFRRNDVFGMFGHRLFSQCF